MGLVTSLVKKHREMKTTLEDVAARLQRLEAISLLLNDLQSNSALTAVTNDYLEALRKLQTLLEDAHQQSKSERAWALFKATCFSKDDLADWNNKLDSLSNDLQLALVVVIASNSMRKEQPVYDVRDEDDSLHKSKQGKLVGVNVIEPEKPIVSEFQSALPGATSVPLTSPPTSPITSPSPSRKHGAKSDSSKRSSSSSSSSPSLSPSGSTREVSATRSHGADPHAPPRSELPPIDQTIVTDLIVTHRLRAIEKVRRGYLRIEERFVAGIFIQCRRLDPFWFRLYFFSNDALNIRYLVFRSFKIDDVTKKFDEYVTPQKIKHDAENGDRSSSPVSAPTVIGTTPQTAIIDKDAKKKDKEKRDSKDKDNVKEKKEKVKDKKLKK